MWCVYSDNWPWPGAAVSMFPPRLVPGWRLLVTSALFIWKSKCWDPGPHQHGNFKCCAVWYCQWEPFSLKIFSFDVSSSVDNRWQMPMLNQYNIVNNCIRYYSNIFQISTFYLLCQLLKVVGVCKYCDAAGAIISFQFIFTIYFYHQIKFNVPVSEDNRKHFATNIISKSIQ